MIGDFDLNNLSLTILLLGLISVIYIIDVFYRRKKLKESNFQLKKFKSKNYMKKDLIYIFTIFLLISAVIYLKFNEDVKKNTNAVSTLDKYKSSNTGNENVLTFDTDSKDDLSTIKNYKLVLEKTYNLYNSSLEFNTNFEKYIDKFITALDELNELQKSIIDFEVQTKENELLKELLNTTGNLIFSYKESLENLNQITSYDEEELSDLRKKKWTLESSTLKSVELCNQIIKITKEERQKKRRKFKIIYNEVE